MASKEDMLEEKTVKELKQMARDKDLSGYSRLRKAELIEMISDNYTEDEVKTWPEEVEEEEETEVPSEEEILAQKQSFTKIVIGAGILIIIMAIFLVLLHLNIIP